MKSYTKLLFLLLSLFGLPAYAAEAPPPTFPLWGNLANGGAAIESYNLIKNLPGHEFVGFTLNCIDGAGGPNDTFVLRLAVFNALTGVLSYELMPSITSLNSTPGSAECSLGPFGVGIAVSGTKRILIVGMAEANHAVIYGYNPETGAQYYVKELPITDADGYTLAHGTSLGELSTAGNFISSKNDQLRIAYFRGNINGSTDIKIKYYDVLTGNQIGGEIAVSVPAPVLPSP